MKPVKQQVVTANRLVDGVVVYLTPNGGWSEWLSEACIAEGKEQGDAWLALGKQAEAAQVVVAPYLIDVIGQDGSVVPVRFRERIRANGPPVRPDLGKHAMRG